MTDNRIVALVNHGIAECIEDVSYINENLFGVGNKEYLVLTNEEADERVKEYILDSVWAFKTEFLIDHFKDGIADDFSSREYGEFKKCLEQLQEKMCESCAPFLRALLKDEDKFVGDAVNADGRGHFLSNYDGEELEEEVDDIWYCIYRQN